MRKILTFLITLFSLTSIAQTVYFGSISKKTSVGLGINGNNVILSIMEINKSKKFDSFELRLYDMNRDKITTNMLEDTIYHLDLDKTYAHQKDFKLSLRDYINLKKVLDSQSYVIINGNEYNGSAFVGILLSLEKEQKLFNNRQLYNIRNITLWNWNRRIEMMRFKIPNNRRFRYIRINNR